MKTYGATKKYLEGVIDKIEAKIQELECDKEIFYSAIYTADEDELGPGKLSISKEVWSLGFKYI